MKKGDRKKKHKIEKMKRRKSAKIKKIITVAVIVLLSGTALFFAGTRLSGRSTGLNRRQPLTVNQDLVIQIADITENALFYPVDVGGTRLEVLAVRTPDGRIRTAYNTCQVCFASGRGYYVQVGSVLVCQNCNMQYTMIQVETEAGGCNPVPIFPWSKIQTDSTITIPRAYLIEARTLFESWR